MKIVESQNSENFNLFKENCNTDSIIYLDIETSGLDPFSSKIYTIQIMFNDTEETYVFDLFSFENPKSIIELIKNKFIVGHNISFDAKMIKYHYKINLLNLYCTQLAHVLINQGKLISQYPSLEELVLEYCNVQLDKEVRESFYKNGEIKSLTNEMLIYSALDVAYLKEIFNKQRELIKETDQVEIIKMECKIIPIVVSMELNGITLDKTIWRTMAQRAMDSAKEVAKEFKEQALDIVFSKRSFANALELLDYLKVTEVKTKRDRSAILSITEENSMKEVAMKYFNPLSNAQALNFIVNILEINIPNTNEKTLNKVYNRHELIKQLVVFREVAKSANTYGEEFLNLINSITNKVHPSFNQLGTQTGRFSSSNPNAQNIPAESEYRSAFVADKGYKFICADYSQQELRVLAAICRDPILIKAFIEELDVHQNTAAYLFDKSYEEVTKDERSKGKALNFGVVYGISEYGLWKNWNIPMEEGKRYLNDFYFKVYVQYAAFKDRVGEMIYTKGYSNTYFGRKRFYQKKVLYNDPYEMYKEKDSIIRRGINHIIQGTSADITKLAMIDMYYNNPFGEEKFKILLQVHDEILCMVSEEIAEEAKEFVASCMLKWEDEVLNGVVPSKIDIKIADYWVH